MGDMDAEGAKTVSLRWLDTDKGHKDRPNYGSRLVVREIKRAMKRSMFLLQLNSSAEKPPLESVNALLSLFVSYNQEEEKGQRTLAMYDVSRAHFHGVPLRRVFVELPNEEQERLARENGPDQANTLACWKKCLYGTADASARWQSHYAQILKEHSFAQGLSKSCIGCACGMGH